MRPPSRLAAVLDLTCLIAAAVLIGSLFMPWYQYGISFPAGNGPFFGLTVSALGRFAGGWRYTILVAALVMIAEVVGYSLLARGDGRGDGLAASNTEWPHRTILWVTSAATLVLVVAAFLDNPLSVAPQAELRYNITLGTTQGAGAYLALAAALVAVGAAVWRLFTQPSTFRR